MLADFFRILLKRAPLATFIRMWMVRPVCGLSGIQHKHPELHQATTTSIRINPQRGLHLGLPMPLVPIALSLWCVGSSFH